MEKGYCSTHDKVFSGYCEGCGPESESKEVKTPSTEYCAAHDRTYPFGATCPGCDPSVIAAQAIEALTPKSLKPRFNHCAEHDQIFQGNECPAGHVWVDKSVPVVENVSAVAATVTETKEDGAGQSAVAA